MVLSPDALEKRKPNRTDANPAGGSPTSCHGECCETKKSVTPCRKEKGSANVKGQHRVFIKCSVSFSRCWVAEALNPQSFKLKLSNCNNICTTNIAAPENVAIQLILGQCCSVAQQDYLHTAVTSQFIDPTSKKLNFYFPF